ncbi:MAG: hypothetical protein VR68_05330 [Peptococcaceae bacterium BRH_c4a]|nr:MAG: hypothetical protein VR68_05330 [Peptococcaceae bacterium BRH_c4a]
MQTGFFCGWISVRVAKAFYSGAFLIANVRAGSDIVQAWFLRNDNADHEIKVPEVAAGRR